MIWRLPRTLLGRVTLGVSLIAAAMLAGEAWVLSWQIHASVQKLHALYLDAVSAPLAGQLSQAGLRGLTEPLPVEIARRFDPQGGTIHYVVLDLQGCVLAASERQQPGIPRRDLLHEDRVTFHSSGRDHRLWGLSRTVPTPGGPVVLQVAQDMRSIFVMLDDVPATALGPILIAFAASTVLLIILVASLTRLVLEPLRRAATEIAAIGPGRVRRLNEVGIPAEAQPLIQAVNGALERLDRAFAQQRAFSQDVAHELRTPLAILMSEIDLIEDPETTARLRRDISELSQIVEQLLDAAEAVSTEPEPGAIVDLVAICESVADKLQPLAERHGCHLAIHSDADPLLARGRSEALVRAVRNLVENAITHAPPGTAVEIRVRQPATVEVADCGPGVPEALRKQVFERFWRADSGRRSGKGLGLAIVAGIAVAHGGRATVRDNEGSGAVFALELQPAEAAPDAELAPMAGHVPPALAAPDCGSLAREC